MISSVKIKPECFGHLKEIGRYNYTFIFDLIFGIQINVLNGKD